jgi:hypothetical protein
MLHSRDTHTHTFSYIYKYISFLMSFVPFFIRCVCFLHWSLRLLKKYHIITHIYHIITISELSMYAAPPPLFIHFIDIKP